MLNYCKKYQVPVVMDSDAHFDLLIGEFDLARALLTKLDFPERSGTEPFRGCREKYEKAAHSDRGDRMYRLFS